MRRSSPTDDEYPPDEELNWTRRQRQVLDLLAGGKSNSDIANELGISLEGAKWHLREIMSKLDVTNREDAAEYWRRRNGWARRTARRVRALLWAFPVDWSKGVPAAASVIAAGLAVTVAAAGAWWVATDTGSEPPTNGLDPTESAPADTATAVEQARPSTPTRAPTATPSPDLPGHDRGTRTGNAEIDRVLDAVLTGNFDELQPLLKFTDMDCMAIQRSSPHPPRCPEGTPAGTEVAALPLGGCPEGRWARPDELPSLLGLYHSPSSRPLAVYSVSDAGSDTGSGWPRGQYAVMVTSPQHASGSQYPPYTVSTFFVEDGRIVSVSQACLDASIDFVLETTEPARDGFVLPPP